MKPSPQYDFPVGVWPETAEHPEPISALFAGIYIVTLNHTESITFIPAVVRAPTWPPELPDDVDTVSSRERHFESRSPAPASR